MVGFAVGEAVRVRTGTPSGHCRTPYYIRGHAGVVDSITGPYADPEQLAYGRPGLPKVTVYRVRFAQPEVWPHYPGPSTDTLLIDIFEHWLERR